MLYILGENLVNPVKHIPETVFEMRRTEAKKIAEHGQMLSHLLTDVMEQDYLLNTTPLQLTRNQFSMLKILNNSGPYAGSELAIILNISRPAISKNIKKLAKLKLINRKSSKIDRRSVTISLTPSGKEFVESYETIRLEKQDRVLEWLSEEELKQFAALLGKYVQHGLLQEEKTDIICLQCSGLIADNCLLAKYENNCRFNK